MIVTDQQIKAVAQRMLAIFDNKPERWTRGADGRDRDGRSVRLGHRDIRGNAVCFCLRGAAEVAAAELYRTDPMVIDTAVARRALERIRDVSGRDPVLFNDDRATTFEMVLQPVRLIAGADA